MEPGDAMSIERASRFSAGPTAARLFGAAFLACALTPAVRANDAEVPDEAEAASVKLDKDADFFKAVADNAALIKPKKPGDEIEDNGANFLELQEFEAYKYVVGFAHRRDPAVLARHSLRGVPINNLFAPVRQNFLRELLHYEGSLRMVTAVPAPARIRKTEKVETLYECWVRTDDRPDDPVCVVVTELPDGIKPGDKLTHKVAFDGYFFKLFRYESRETNDEGKHRWRRPPLHRPHRDRGREARAAGVVRLPAARHRRAAAGRADRGRPAVVVLPQGRHEGPPAQSSRPAATGIRSPSNSSPIWRSGMSDKPSADTGKAARPGAGAPVIRRAAVNEDEARTRLMNRQMPAVFISGAIHVLVIGTFILLFGRDQPADAKPLNPPTARIDDAKEQEDNLTNVDLGFDANLEAATTAEREEPVNVEAPVMDNEPVGIENQKEEVAPQTAAAGFGDTADVGVKGDDAMSPLAKGDGGTPGLLTVAGMRGRSGSTKDKLLAAGGGNSESELAVANGLAWLAKQQQKDGSWEFDGSHKDERISSTGLALLPFLAAGETHKTGKKYQTYVAKGLKYLTDKLNADGSFNMKTHAFNYSQAIGTIPLCEAAGMTRDSAIKAKAQQAINFVVKSQGKNGSWGYQPKTDGDTSIVGWNVQALKTPGWPSWPCRRTPSARPRSSWSR